MTSPYFEYSSSLELPVIGMEAEFELLINGVVTRPESLWRSPRDFVEGPLLRRSKKSTQLPTGGALYFDEGVLEVVTPVIEIAPRCTTRMVRSLWEQVEYLHHHLDVWGRNHSRKVQLRGFSSHYNVSYEIPRESRSAERTIQKLATILAHVITVPLIVIGTNRRSTGIGVRPLGDRIELTLDFTPDASLMLATAALVVGVSRDMISWPSYMLTLLEELPIPTLLEVDPGKHTTRKGWLTKDYHFPESPFTSDIDAAVWRTRRHGLKSLREIAFETAWFFRDSIRRHSDPYSARLLFAIFSGSMPSLLDLPDRPGSYDRIGSAARWGVVIPELTGQTTSDSSSLHDALEPHMRKRQEWRARHLLGDPTEDQFDKMDSEDETIEHVPEEGRRATDRVDPVLPPWSADLLERRKVAAPALKERRRRERRITPFTRSSLSRSRYEEVFRRAGSGWSVQLDGERYLPCAIKGWYHVELQNEKGQLISVSIDRLADCDWSPPGQEKT